MKRIVESLLVKSLDLLILIGLFAVCIVAMLKAFGVI